MSIESIIFRILHAATFCKAIICVPRFKAELRSRYDWSDQDLEAEWQAAFTNPQAVWSKDDYGQDVVSLLKTTSASSARELQHNKSVSRTSETDSGDVESAFTGFLSSLEWGSSRWQVCKLDFLVWFHLESWSLACRRLRIHHYVLRHAEQQFVTSWDAYVW
jgi:hypothetical protein